MNFNNQFEQLDLSAEYWEQLAPVVASIGRWIWNLDSGICQIDETLKDLTGWPHNNLEFPAQSFLDRIHPGDLTHVNEAVQSTIDTGVAYRTQFRFVRFDKSIIWFDGRGAIIDFEDGKRYLAGVNFDISEYKT